MGGGRSSNFYRGDFSWEGVGNLPQNSPRSFTVKENHISLAVRETQTVTFIKVQRVSENNDYRTLYACILNIHYVPFI